ncbi:MAG TPA: hypothetical protein VFB84_13855 [Micromonosporaceae bacterium]|nr:hypothetical protein [Micromonosporaceae bacterium]
MSESPAQLARRMWTLFEPVHEITYFSPEARAAYEAAGLRGGWRSYFAGRSAPLGPVPAAPVVAAFYGFAPGLVAKAIPSAWQQLPPEQVLQARLAGVVAALSRLLNGAGPEVDGAADQAPVTQDQVAEAAELLEAAVDRLDLAGRVLGAANAALPRPSEPLARLWHATTVLREHRGDGHNAALVAAQVGGCESLAWRAAFDMPREALQPYRGWSDEEWHAAEQRLVERGWLDRDRRPTPAGVQEYGEIELSTDRSAAQPWQALDPAAVGRLQELLAPIATACYGALPPAVPTGLPDPGTVSATA